MQFFEPNVNDMAALYKRYIPTKPKTEESIFPVKVTESVVPESADATPEKKRKRERTQEEIVERKAKKLKKKGIDPATIAHEDVAIKPTNTSQDARPGNAEQQEVTEDTNQVQSEFAHITSTKKRHKLEKEARKARKAAKKDEPVREELPAGFNAPEKEQSGQSVVGASIGVNGDQDIDEPNGSNDKEIVDDSTSTRKGKKRRKEDASQQRAESQEAVEPSHVIESNSRPEGKPSEELPQPKRRRHKLEGVIEQSRVEDAETEDEEHLRKHTSLLGKFQNSARRTIQHSQEESFEKLPEQPVVRHLELPPPERTPTPEFESEDAALPSWLAKPTVLTSNTQATFKDLEIASETADRLTKLGFAKALPVQQALVPILMPPGLPGAAFMPGTEDVLPDIAVSAPTGSGKTIAYLLPMIEALRRHSQHGKLSAIIIVPTRELVMQVAAVAESLVKGSSIKVGMVTGNGKFKDEQEKIIKRNARYDPAGYKKLVDVARSQLYPPDEDSEEFQSYLEQFGQEDVKRQQWLQDTVGGLVGHVPIYESTVDILVATPGRLLEHINSTLGFNLVHLQWLVIDEADKLLDNQYEGFLESLNTDLTMPRSEEEQDLRERKLRSIGLWDERKERRLRKAILSATMTRDISKLTSLKLQRPKMIVVRGAEGNENQAVSGARDAVGGSSVKENADGFELPHPLVEYCVPVGDGSEKPLVAVELLRSKILDTNQGDPGAVAQDPHRSNDVEDDDDSDSDSDSDSDDSSSLSSDDSDSSNSTSSDESLDSDNDSVPQDSPAPEELTKSRSAGALRPSSPLPARAPTVLIFTSSNESANRLSHLLQGIQPGWKSWITTLVKTNPGKVRIRSKADEPALVISTDRAARGLDAFSNRPITHVIQYDVPRSLTSYVHRVGRTARAGREGDAWTLYTHAEARWFVNEITKAANVRRRGPVERVKVFMADDGTRERYQKVLAGMRDEVFGAPT